MSADWPIKKLSDVAEFLNSKRIPLKSLDRAKRQGEYPYYGASGVVDHIDDYIFDGTFLLISEDGENLRTRNTPIAFKAKGKFWVNNHAHILAEKEEGILDYLEYYFSKLDINPYITGAVQPKLNKANLDSIELPIPPKEERLVINKILNSFTHKIEVNRTANQTLETIAQTLFKSWFVDFDPVKTKLSVLAAGGSAEEAERAAMCAISARDEASLNTLQTEQPEAYAELARTAALFPSAMQDSELGEIPLGWGTIPLYETAEYVNGTAFKAKDFTDDSRGLPIIKIAELKQGISSSTKFTRGAFKDKYALKNGDVLYSWSGSPETSLEVFKWFGGSGWLNQHIFKLNFISDEQKYFAYYLLKYMKPILIATAKQKQTTGLGHITVADMKRLLVVNPSKNILKCFADKCSALYNKCSNLAKENGSLTATRDTLLPKLLSGELTFSDKPISQTKPPENVMLKKQSLTMGVA